MSFKNETGADKESEKCSGHGIAQEVFGIAAAAAFSFLQFVMLEYSCNLKISIIENFSNKDHGFIGLNVLALFVMQMIIRLFAGKWSVTLLISTVIASVWSVANYFTVLYHGGPLYPSELRSAATAVEVMGDYSYDIDHYVKRLILMGAVMLAASVLYIFLERKGRFHTWRRTAGTAAGIAAGAACLYVFLFSPVKITPKLMVGWDWKHGVERFGFPVTAIEDVYKMINSISKPDGYSAAKVAEYEAEGIAASAEQMPDIILVLNETYYCMDDYIETGADLDYMEGFYGIDNAVYGHSAASRVGGGTNDSEFEILTGNAMALMQNYAPFNYYDFTEYDNDYVHYLKGLGYRSAVLHEGTPTNYSRNKVYPLLGFDDIVLGRQAFNHHDFTYGKRTKTDSDNYKELIDHYDALGDGPRFAYLLTYQNHGGYEKNDDELDVVHVSKDYGDLTDDMNEYLSTISYSSKAFAELIDHFRSSDRPVIICMTGDHSPSFINKLEEPEGSKAENKVKKTMVPYVIWSNIELDQTGLYTDNMTHYELMAMILKMAGLPLTPYQKAILDLHDQVPVLTNSGFCKDKEGNIFGREDSDQQDLINKYYYLEYNSLKHDSGYREEMFRLPNTAEREK